MDRIVKILFSIINLFLGAFVSYKVYGYFSPHVGFNLPELSYTNMLAIAFIISIMLTSIEMKLSIQTIQDKVMGEEKPKMPLFFVKTIVLLILWLFNYLYYIILF